VELFGGYALSSHTDVANQVNSEVASHSTTSHTTDADFAGLWQIQWNTAAGLRWAPLYGKLNLFADMPVHFQMYLGAGAGVAGLRRESVTYCLAPAATDATTGTKLCDQPLVENRISPLAQFGGGMRFWLGPKAVLKLEARDYTFPDKYQVNINRAQAATGDPAAGQQVSSPGFEHVIFVSAGVSYIF
jgi:outer membrane beta-barrel protein